MAYQIAVLDDDVRELNKMEEMLSLYGETHPQHELEIACFQEIKPFMDAVVCSGDRKGKMDFRYPADGCVPAGWEWHKECGNPAGKGL